MGAGVNLVVYKRGLMVIIRGEGVYKRWLHRRQWWAERKGPIPALQGVYSSLTHFFLPLLELFTVSTSFHLPVFSKPHKRLTNEVLSFPIIAQFVHNVSLSLTYTELKKSYGCMVGWFILYPVVLAYL